MSLGLYQLYQKWNRVLIVLVSWDVRSVHRIEVGRDP
jgi:hypothetical protein